jgi:hypothetical protein
MAERLPLELVVMEFPEPDVPEAVDIALSRLTFLGDLRVLEAAAVIKDADGVWTSEEVDHLISSRGTDVGSALREPPLPAGLYGASPTMPILNPAELDRIGRMLDPGRAALALVLEHTWINELAQAFRKVRGAVLLSAWLGGSPNGGSHAGHDH